MVDVRINNQHHHLFCKRFCSALPSAVPWGRLAGARAFVRACPVLVLLILIREV
jgi:hypothetical protein